MSGSDRGRAAMTLRSWTRRQWVAAAAAGVVALVLIGVPTDLIPNGIFSRSIAPPWWATPVWWITSVLTGMLVATYVDRAPAPVDRKGGIGAVLGFLAVGCPVCNKLVLVALGTTGAISIFQPLQPVLAAASLLLLGWALRSRLAGAVSCAPRNTGGH